MAPPFQHARDFDCAKAMRSLDQLPEAILHEIHALMPLEDSARAACVSRGFLHSWRCYPKLMLSADSLRIQNKYASRKDEIKKDVINFWQKSASLDDETTRDFIHRVDSILQNHSGIGVKLFSLRTYPCSYLNPSILDRWLQTAITPGIENFELSMKGCRGIKYDFPCSVLSSERSSSIQVFRLAECSFHSAEQVGRMSSLTYLDLHSVHIAGEELYGFLSNCHALEKIHIYNCDDIICLKVPCLLKQLSVLFVFGCSKLETIESNAPNLSSFSYIGHPIHISLGDALHVREVRFYRTYSSDALHYARTKLPSIAPNVQTLVLQTRDETVNTPTTFGKFLQLKYLEMTMPSATLSPHYDFYSLVSFLDASPSLETLVLRILSPSIRHDSIIEDSGGDSSRPRFPVESCHDNLKKVMITGFCSARSMIELTIHIIEKSKSLECLTLDTTRGHDMKNAKIGKCWPLDNDARVEAEKACVAIQRYIEGRVPSTVKLTVIEPCSECLM